MERINNIQLTENAWAILRYLYHKDARERKDDIQEIMDGLKIERPLAILMVAQLMNEGYVSRIVEPDNHEEFVLSLEGFELMKARKLT